jgi:glyoxylase-like metal-dependent hydrolase (beta-lactamase superfamily II)
MAMDQLYKVGNATILRIPDIALSHFTPGMLFPGVGTDELENVVSRQPATALSADRGHLPLNIHSWLVRQDGRTVLIDTGAGNDKARPHAKYFDRLHTPFLKTLADAGVVPEEVDYVLLTHLHVDHVGWNTRLVEGRWVPTFPNARYVFSRAEHAYFTDPANHNERNRTSFMVQRDSVDPVIEAGLADMIEVDGREVIEGFAFHPAPGHTLDHAVITLAAKGETALFSGDAMHHPLQVERPEWNSVFDAFGDQARTSRKWLLDQAAQRDASVFTAHFPDTAAGRVVKRADDYVWVALKP